MKIKYSELKKMVVEEMKALGMLPINESEKLEPVEDRAKKGAVEVEPGEEGRHNEKPTDMVKALKIKEAKLVKALGETRAALKKHGK